MLAITFGNAFASMNYEIHGATLIATDRWLGLDWRAFSHFIHDDLHAGLAATRIYVCFIPEPLIAIAILSLYGRVRVLNTLILSWIIGLAITMIVSGLYPSEPVYFLLGIDALSEFPDMKNDAGYGSWAIVEGFRHHQMSVLLDQPLTGFVSFPSFHAAGSVMITRAFWHLKNWRWPVAVLNTSIIFVTPFVGGHYFCDILAGVLVGFLSYAAAKGIARFAHEPDPRPSAATNGR